MDTVVDPPLFRAFPFNIGLRILAPGGLRPTPEQREGYHRFTQMGDPLADDLIAAFRRLPAGFGRAQFDTAVAEGLSAADNPIPELVALFEQVEARPYWVDQKKLDHAARVLARFGWCPAATSSAKSSGGATSKSLRHKH